MSSMVVDSVAAAALSGLRTAVDELLALSFDALTDDEVLDVAREVEAARRRLVPVEHAVIGQVQQRSLPFTHGCRTATVFLSELLRIGRGEASARVKAAEALGHRRTVTGQPIEPRFALVAAAQAEGVLSDRHAAVITGCVQKLPVEIADEFGGFVEKTLVEQGRTLDPTLLHRHADALAYVLNQDGTFDEEKHRERTRSFDWQLHPDGSCSGEFHLTAECTAHLLAAFDALTKPQPKSKTAAEAGPDPRTATQRRHDAFQEILKLVQRARLLPTAGGITSTVVLTMSADAWVTGEGTAQTGHGYTVSAQTARRWAGYDTRLILTLLDKTKAVHAYSGSHRLFTEQQRLAMIARDLGCSFPGCDAGPAWCESHHIQEWSAGGTTTIDNGALACCGHHREHEAMGWRAIMLDGRPHWIPPKWLDPEQKPRRNTRHDRPDPPSPE